MIALYCTFNNEKTIRKSLQSILPYVDKVIALDGAWKRFPHKSKTGSSTDATKAIFFELCRSKLVWVDSKNTWKSQVAKKNALLNLVETGEWFLRIGGDEIIRKRKSSSLNVAGALRVAEASDLTSIGVPIKNFSPLWKGFEVRHKNGHAYPFLTRPIPKEMWNKLKWKANFGVGMRIIQKQAGLHFKGHHSTMFVGGKRFRIQSVLDDVLLINMQYEIGWKRWMQKIKYKGERYEANDFEG